MFTGRKNAIARIENLIARSSGPVVVTGPGGMGKSALAVRIAHLHASIFPDGQLFVGLRGFDANYRPLPVGGGLRKLLESLGVEPGQVPADDESRIEVFRQLTAERRLLVVLDNALDAEQVRPLLPAGEGHLVLVTSRNELPELTAYDGAQPLRLGPFDPTESREALQRRLFRSSADLGRDDQAAVDSLARACAGLPLAIAVITARLSAHPDFSLPAYAASLTDSGGLLTVGTDGLARDLIDVFSWSYRRLTGPAARLFRLLGIHPGPDFAWPLVAALMACEPERAQCTLSELVQANLLTERAPGRFTFHDLLRLYARSLAQQNDSAAERSTARKLMFDHYVRSGAAAARALQPHRAPLEPPAPPIENQGDAPIDRLGALRWFDLEITNVMAALAVAREQQLDESIWQLTWVLPHYLDWIGDWPGWAEIEGVALGAATRRGDQAGVGLSLLYLGQVRYLLGDRRRSEVELRAALRAYESIGDLCGQGRVCNSLSVTVGATESPEAGLQWAERSVDRWRRSGDRAGLGRGLNALATTYIECDRPAEALAVADEAIALLHDNGDPLNEAQAWESLGEANLHLGRFEFAVDCFRTAIGTFDQSPVHLARQLDLLAITHIRAGDREAADAVWVRAEAAVANLATVEGETVRENIRASREAAHP